MLTMQLMLEELPSALFMFFCGAVGYFFMNWVKHGLPFRTQQDLLQEKLASTSTDSEDEQGQTVLHSQEPQMTDLLAKKTDNEKVRTRQPATGKVAAQSDANLGIESASAVEVPSLVGWNTKLESETASSGELASVDAELLLELLRPSHGEHETGNAIGSGGCGSCLGDNSKSLNKALASPQEAERGCKIEQPAMKSCHGFEDTGAPYSKSSEDPGALGDEELRQLLGEWPETESEESCSDLGIDGMWDGSADDAGGRAPFEESRQELDGWTAASGNYSSAERGRWCRDPSQEGTPSATGWFSDEKWYGRNKKRSGCMSPPCQNETDIQDIQDDWMVPFDELIKGSTSVAMLPAFEAPQTPPVQQQPPSPLPATGTPHGGGAVCIWNAQFDGCCDASGLAGHGHDGGDEIFTDGQHFFQPVPSSTGESLFTDGRQLYAPVCVMLPPPIPAVALAPESQTQEFGGFVPDRN